MGDHGATKLSDLIGEQYEKPIRVVASNAAEGWSRDITEDIARQIVERATRASEYQSPHKSS